MDQERPMTHDELVQRAAKWLAGTMKCSVVLTEFSAYVDTGEIPDAIGWRYGRSVLVECKASRADFMADRKKASRLAMRSGGPRLGQRRFYFTPPGLVSPGELPEGWGLAECGKVVRVIRTPDRDEYAAVDREIAGLELPLALSVIRRLTVGAGLDVLKRKMLVVDDELTIPAEGSEED